MKDTNFISRQAVLDECNKDGAYGYISAAELMKLPIIDIVRCKECVNRLSFDDQTIPPGCSIWGRFTTDDTFCSYGERRADE